MPNAVAKFLLHEKYMSLTADVLSRCVLIKLYAPGGERADERRHKAHVDSLRQEFAVLEKFREDYQPPELEDHVFEKIRERVKELTGP